MGTASVRDTLPPRKATFPSMRRSPTARAGNVYPGLVRSHVPPLDMASALGPSQTSLQRYLITAQLRPNEHRCRDTGAAVPWLFLSYMVSQRQYRLLFQVLLLNCVCTDVHTLNATGSSIYTSIHGTVVRHFCLTLLPEQPGTLAGLCWFSSPMTKCSRHWNGVIQWLVICPLWLRLENVCLMITSAF